MRPTLAQKYDPTKVHFPVLVSPKLDGIRCLAHKNGGVWTLWSRDEKPILSCEHIIETLNTTLFEDGTVLDGELYVHPDVMSFQVLNGTVRRLYHDPRALPIKYFVFDVAKSQDGVQAKSYKERYEWLLSKTSNIPAPHQLHGMARWACAPLYGDVLAAGRVLLLRHQLAQDADQVKFMERSFVEAKLEGAMLRTDIYDKKAKAWRTAGYETEETGHTRRTWGLQKVKSFEDAEFRVVDIFEEHDLNGNPKGRAAGFIVRDESQVREDGSAVQFQCSGLTDQLKEEIWANPSAYVGQLAKVKFFGRSDDGVPRFPNFVCMRPEHELDAAD